MLILADLDIYSTMAIVWTTFIIVTAIIELITTDLVTIWFTIGAIGSLIASLCKANIIIQLVIFFIISFIALILTRPLAKKIQEKDVIRTNADKVIGEIGIITKGFEGIEIGEVKVEEREWRAISNEGKKFEDGEKVIIDAISGTKLIVSKLPNNNEK